MTAPLLLACISAALLFQLTVGIGVTLWRRRGVGVRSVSEVDEFPAKVAKGAWQGTRKFRVVRREFEDAAHTQCSFYIAPVDGAALPLFKPGQYLTFALKIVDAASQSEARTVTRCYSLSDLPDPARYRVTIKRLVAPADRPELPPGVSSNYFHDRVHVGDVLEVKAPSGHFFIDADPNVPAVFVAGGIGITPILSMLRWCLAEQPERTVYLYYGVRNSTEHAFTQLLDELARTHSNFRLTVVYSRPSSHDVQGRDFHRSGHVNINLLRGSLPHGRYQLYVCGPASMMESVVPALTDWGVLPTDIHYEAFGPASVHAAPNNPGLNLATPVEVKFHRTGRALLWDGKDMSLLDFAERQGVVVDSGCRAGSCGTCETKLISGTVRYAHVPDHDVAPGHCLLCVGVPESALILEA